jgi:hypothetical protein
MNDENKTARAIARSRMAAAEGEIAALLAIVKSEVARKLLTEDLSIVVEARERIQQLDSPPLN